MIRRILPFLFLIPFITVFFSCGKTDESKVKQFRLAVFSADKSYNRVFTTLVNKYNESAGFRALEFSESTAGANSEIHVVEGLAERNPGKVGFGQWLTDTESRANCLICPPTSKNTSYAMRVEFDAKYIRDRIQKIPMDQVFSTNGKLDGVDNSAKVAYLELFNLFTHETGHGLTMDHTPDSDSRNIMYAYVGCKDQSDTVACGKDYTNYFQRVRNFFNDI